MKQIDIINEYRNRFFKRFSSQLSEEGTITTYNKDSNIQCSNDNIPRNNPIVIGEL